jgi:hypothetical protein
VQIYELYVLKNNNNILAEKGHKVKLYSQGAVYKDIGQYLAGTINVYPLPPV